ncbi:MAG: hypothetical protein QY306_18105 [Anaerolineales bacterium]|nr:MAG: hypothetical protein QY306_18105 [Anaerolineales bacterium]
MSEGVFLFIVGTILSIILTVAFGLLVNDIQHRRERGPFSIKRKSPNRIAEEYSRAKRLHNDPMLLGLNVARWLIMGVESLVIHAVFILIGIYFSVFFIAFSNTPPINDINTKSVAALIIGVTLIPIFAKAVLDIKDFASCRDDLMRLIDFENYENFIKKLMEKHEVDFEVKQGKKNKSTRKPKF